MMKPILAKAFCSPKGLPLNSSPVIFVAMHEDELVGYIHISRWAFDGGTIPYINVEDIHVLKSHRGRGVGEALIKYVKTLADEYEWKNLTATVWAGNDRSQELFARSGFSQRNITMRYGPVRPAENLKPAEYKPYRKVALALLPWFPVIVIGLLLLLSYLAN